MAEGHRMVIPARGLQGVLLRSFLLLLYLPYIHRTIVLRTADNCPVWRRTIVLRGHRTIVRWKQANRPIDSACFVRRQPGTDTVSFSPANPAGRSGPSRQLRAR